MFLLSGSVGGRHSVQKLQDIFLLSGSLGSRHSVKLQDIFLLSGSVGSRQCKTTRHSSYFLEVWEVDTLPKTTRHMSCTFWTVCLSRHTCRNYKTCVLYFLDSVGSRHSVQKLQDICLVLSGHRVGARHSVQKLQDICLVLSGQCV